MANSTFQDRMLKIAMREDRLQLIYQWVKTSDITFTEFAKLIEYRNQLVAAEQISDDVD